jgi:hypothetical protein
MSLYRRTREGVTEKRANHIQKKHIGGAASVAIRGTDCIHQTHILLIYYVGRVLNVQLYSHSREAMPAAQASTDVKNS